MVFRGPRRARRLLRSCLAILSIAPLTPHALGQTLVLEVSGDEQNDRMGMSVARLGDVDGDGRADFAVAAQDDELSVPEAGVVTVYSGATLRVLHELEGEFSFEDFGAAIASAGDVDGDGKDDVLVAATKHPAGGVDAGAVYLFSGADGSLLHKVLGDAPGDQLGGALDGLGDVDGDGVPDFAAGSLTSDAAGQDSGMVRVYSGADGSTLHTWHGADTREFFGCDLAGLGDLDGDGFPEVAIGAYGEDTGGDRAGCVHVVSAVDGKRLHKITGEVPIALFGRALCRVGDVDGDGKAELAVAAPNEDDGAESSAGTVRVFSGANASLLMTFRGQSKHDQLGSSLDGGLDVDGDGSPDLLVGAPQPLFGAGIAMLFSVRDGTLLMTLEGEAPGDVFGADVALIADVDLDGRADLLVGAPDASPNGYRSGRAYAYVACAQPETYCDAKPSSLGCLPAIGWQGSPSLSGDDDFHVTATSIVAGRHGRAFFGFAPSDHPFNGGTLCVLPPLRRTPVQFSGGGPAGQDCSGSFSFHFSQALMAEQGIGLGSSIYFQYWYRDPAHPDGTGIGMSDGLKVQVCP